MRKCSRKFKNLKELSRIKERKIGSVLELTRIEEKTVESCVVSCAVRKHCGRQASVSRNFYCFPVQRQFWYKRRQKSAQSPFTVLLQSEQQQENTTILLRTFHFCDFHFQTFSFSISNS